jgi:hypothetical protein
MAREKFEWIKVRITNPDVTDWRHPEYMLNELRTNDPQVADERISKMLKRCPHALVERWTVVE